MFKTIYTVVRNKFIRVSVSEINVLPQRKNESTSDLHRGLGFVLILAQCFALMPVQGVTATEIHRIKFKWLSLRTLYTGISLCGSLAQAVFNAVRFLHTGMHFGDLSTVCYFTSTSLIIVMSVRLARSWRSLNEQWLVMENAMRHYEYQPNFACRYGTTTLIVMLLALGEHLLFVSKLLMLSFDCEMAETHPMMTYFGVAFAQTFAMTPFAYWKAFVLEFINITATFAWNFMDLFVMLMCTSLAERFRQINRHVSNAEVAHGEPFWRDVREDYNRLAMLCRTLDDYISHLVSLSFANNMFFICVQLFNSMRPMSGIMNTIYFVCSFGFLLGRTAAVLVHAAWINDESTIILNALFNIPSEDFDIEASRLIQQIFTAPVAITGSRYFLVTRDLCLKVAGAIITFELILQQMGPIFLNTNDKQSDAPFCLR